MRLGQGAPFQLSHGATASSRVQRHCATSATAENSVGLRPFAFLLWRISVAVADHIAAGDLAAVFVGPEAGFEDKAEAGKAIDLFVH